MRGPQKPPATRLAARRQQLEISQRRLSELSGVPVRTLRRLESGDTDNPPLRHLVNLAMALDVQLMDIVEDEWLEWKVFDARAPGPPERGHWLPERERPES